MKLAIAIWCFGLVLLSSYQLLAYTASHYGDICDEDTGCTDHRMSCTLNNTDDPYKICLCTSRFFIWSEDFQQCVQAMNMSAILKALLEHRDAHTLNSVSEHETFVKLGAVGLIAVFTLLIFIMCCIAYGCCACTRVNDKDVQHSPLIKGERNKWEDLPSTMPATFDHDIDI
ncbi:hypothetical protein L9F63_020095 [Diploptera punctata]|uniref:Uncharacterized protein n=1 Tax=Diploptera punctata TaxID=6984 RepID=A0AAD7ZTP5_DIPPU|nr:hypothetical protein L9F63_020095 [Diploptera punctata]